MASEEIEEVYTEDEANEAMSLIQEHKLPISELQYALKYVRILHQGHDPQGSQGVAVPQASVPEVEPPEFNGDYDILDRFANQNLK